MPEAIFKTYRFTEEERAQFDRDGHYLLPGLLRTDACDQLTKSCKANQDLLASKVEGKNPKHYSAEFDPYFENLMVHPQLLEMARSVLGSDIRLDHCVTLNRRGGYPGSGWHSHPYADDEPSLGLVRIFFYVNGFEAYDGALKVVPGSHLFRDSTIEAEADEELLAGWMAGRTHPLTGDPLRIEELSAPPGSVALLWTHAAHGVSPRRTESGFRWAIVFGYRNPGQPCVSRWIRPEFEQKDIPGADGLLNLY